VRRRRGATTRREHPVESIHTALDELEHKLAQTLLVESREELTRADGKASILLAALGIGISAILAAILAGDWSPFKLDQPYQRIWWVGSGFAAVAFFCLCAAVYPKVKRKTKAKGVTYFGDVAAPKTVDELRAALKRSETDPAERSATQLHVIARLVDRKYRYIRFGLIALGIAIALMLGAVLAERLA
jgi:MFS family permease